MLPNVRSGLRSALAAIAGIVAPVSFDRATQIKHLTPKEQQTRRDARIKAGDYRSRDDRRFDYAMAHHTAESGPVLANAAASYRKRYKSPAIAGGPLEAGKRKRERKAIEARSRVPEPKPLTGKAMKKLHRKLTAAKLSLG